MTNSNPNTSPPRNDKEYFTPLFEDREGNEVVFLYQNYICPTVKAAEAVAVRDAVQIVMMGLMYKRIMTIPEDANVPHVECVVKDEILNIEYKIAIVKGPEFEKHYDPDLAAKTDAEEDRVRRAKEQAEEIDRRNYEAEVNILNSALDKPDPNLH